MNPEEKGVSQRRRCVHRRPLHCVDSDTFCVDEILEERDLVRELTMITRFPRDKVYLSSMIFQK